MRLVDGRSGIEWLDPDECRKLLSQAEVGRLAVVQGGAPVIFPVNYVLDGHDIVFRTDPGTKLGDGPRAPACFEIDSIDHDTRSGWSVVVSGRLEEVTKYDATEWKRVQRLPIEPWAGGDKEHWMRLVAGQVSGRRIRPSE